jgi:predicted nucleic-acid-binding Zn-ribbon protein
MSEPKSDEQMEQKQLACPVCQSNKAEIAGENVKLSGRFEDKEFLTTALTVLKCMKCGYYMFFDNAATFTTKDK